MALIPQIENPIDYTTDIDTIPSKTYKLIVKEDKNDRIIGYIDNLEAVKQAIYHILSVERYSYDIYSDNYGIELEQYTGKGIDYLKATIENTLQEALLIDLRIINVTVTDIITLQKDSVQVKFNVTSIYGDLQMEVNINV